MKKALLIPIVLTLITTLSLPSCSSGVSPEEYTKLSADLATAQAEIKDLQAEIKALQEELSAKEKAAQERNGDIPESIAFEHRLGRSLNDFWVGRISPDGSGYVKIDVDEYWTNEGLTIPAGDKGLAVYTRRVFTYPQVSFRTRLPSLEDGPSIWMGFEQGGHHPLPLACLYTAGGHAYLLFGGTHGIPSVSITSLLPADYDTALHYYTVKVNKCSVELFIDGEIKAVGLLGLPEAIPEWKNNPPYALGVTSDPPCISLPAFVEIDNYARWESTLPIPGNYHRYAAADGDPLPPRQYPLYTENTSTKWNGLSTDAAITSHPVPVWGHERKTLFFQSDAAGTLTIQIYTGGEWRDLTSITLEADTLLVYNLNAEVPIARCVYTPVGTDTIAAAEFHLAGSR